MAVWDAWAKRLVVALSKGMTRGDTSDTSLKHRGTRPWFYLGVCQRGRFWVQLYSGGDPHDQRERPNSQIAAGHDSSCPLRASEVWHVPGAGRNTRDRRVV